ncbi:MAG: LysR substrate-binding domain-containing protein [Gammaproteobacteria bacterium]
MAVMHKIDIRRIDLNLLIAFEAIYQEGSVTRASHRLFLSQSAMSHALARLRELCGDPLFERQGNAMVPTAMARQLVTPVQAALGLLERSLNRSGDRDGIPSLEPLRIGLISLYEPAFLPRLAARLRKGIDAYEVGIARYPPGKLEVNLAQGRFDVAIQMSIPHAAQIRSMPLLRERLGVLLRAVHPALSADGSIALADYLAERHVLMAPDERWTDFVSQEFQRLGLSRTIALRCQDFWSACEAVVNSELLLTAQRSALEQVHRSFPGTVIAPMPVGMDTVEEVEIRLYWLASREEEPGNRWLRENLQAVLASR